MVGGVWENAYTGRDKRRGLTIGEEGVGESSGPRSGRAAVGGPKKPPAPLGGRGIKRFYGQPEVSQALVAAEEKAAAKRKLKASESEVPLLFTSSSLSEVSRIEEKEEASFPSA